MDKKTEDKPAALPCPKVRARLLGTMFLDFTKGGYSQTFEDRERSITKVVYAQTRNATPTITWFVAGTPYPDFPSFCIAYYAAFPERIDPEDAPLLAALIAARAPAETETVGNG